MKVSDKKKYFLMSVITCFILLFLNHETFADGITIGVSPSFIKDVKLSKTEETSLKLTIYNKSSFANTLNDEQKKSFTVNIDLDIESEIIPKEEILLSESSFTLNHNEEKEIEVVLPSSKNYKLDKENEICLTVSGTTDESFGFNYAPTIKVPLYVYTHENLLSKATLNKVTITDTYTLTKNKNNKNSLKEILFQKPFKFETLKNDKQIIVYDIPKNKKVTLKECIAYSKENISSKKYIYLEYLDKSFLNLPIESINFNNDNIEFIINNSSIKLFVPNTYIIDLIKSQMENIASVVNSPPTINYLLENINIYKNKDFIPNELFLDLNITNQGQKTISPKGKITILSENNMKIKEISLTSNLLNPSKTMSSYTKLSLPSLSEGKYKLIISANLDGESTIEKTIDLNIISLRFKFIVLCLLIIVLVFIYIFCTFIKLKKQI